MAAETGNERVTIERRLRPLRLAFLAGVGDREQLLRIFEVNTCLWGGRYNALIPSFTRTPRWWDRDRAPFRRPRADQILAGYVDAFEPDYLVVRSDGDRPTLSRLHPAHVITWDEVVSDEYEDGLRRGVQVGEVFGELYDRAYQFVRRHPRPAVIALPPTGAFALFTAVCCGAFPSDSALAAAREQYRITFDADEIVLDPTTLFSCVDGDTQTPLRMGSAGLRRHYRGMRADAALFLMDATSVPDLIDFWNLRALGWQIVPVPRQWADQLVESACRFIQRNHVPYRHNPAMFHETRILQSRTVRESELEEFRRALAEQLGKSPESRFSTQHWYPRLWDEWARPKDFAERCDVSAFERDTEAPKSSIGIGVPLLAPTFSNSVPMTGDARWVNVLRIQSYDSADDRATMLPEGIPAVAEIVSRDRGSTSISSEGTVVRCEYPSRTHYLQLPTGTEVFKAWFAGQDIEAATSGAGEICRQVLSRLGGFWGAGYLANPEIVKLLNRMAMGLVESEAPDIDKSNPRSRKARARMIALRHWYGLLHKANPGHPERAERHLKALTDRGVLRLGLRLQCPSCRQRNWYGLEDLANSLRCERCLSAFPFPASAPPRDGWYYRTQGPFSIENYAQGAYAVALALRFLIGDMHATATWTTGLELLMAGKKAEADFLMWWRSGSWFANRPYLVFGECKTFDRFDAEDRARASALAVRFPGAVLAFVTLRDELSAPEKRWMAQFARRGRRHLGAGRTTNPCLVLTRHELVSDFGPPYCWEDAGGRFADFAKSLRRTYSLPALCDATQQLHLGMESYDAWFDEEHNRRVARMKGKK